MHHRIPVRPVAALGSWSVVANSLATGLLGVGYSWRGDALFDLSLNPGRGYVLDGEVLAALFDNLEAFLEKDAIRRALDRLNTALRETKVEEKAIDFGIALEVMLLHDAPNMELTLRMSLRGAAFLEDRGEKRVKAYKFLKEAYGLRSRAVHSGRLEESGEVQKTLDQVADVCARIARKLINVGSFPDWDNVVLG
jgi:hypothetical protein